MVGLRRVMEMSFAKASESLGEDRPSAVTHWRRLQDTEPEPKVPDDRTLDTFLVEATDVPKWKAFGQLTLTINQHISRDEPRYGWAQLDRLVVGLTTGNEEGKNQVLQEKPIRRLLHYGELELLEVCETAGRCTGHREAFVISRKWVGDRNKKLYSWFKQAEFDCEEPKGVQSEINDWIDEHLD